MGPWTFGASNVTNDRVAFNGCLTCAGHFLFETWLDVPHIWSSGPAETPSGESSIMARKSIQHPFSNVSCRAHYYTSLPEQKTTDTRAGHPVDCCFCCTVCRSLLCCWSAGIPELLERSVLDDALRLGVTSRLCSNNMKISIERRHVVFSACCAEAQATFFNLLGNCVLKTRYRVFK